MLLAATSGSSGTPNTVTIIVAVIAALASLTAAGVAARSARSSKRLEIQAQRIRDLESRISDRKYKTYEPFLEMIFNFFRSFENGQPANIDPAASIDGFREFAKQITTYGSDEAVEAYHKFQLASSNGVPVFISMRLMADFLLAVRKDLSYPDTDLSRATLLATAFRVGDFYRQGEEFRKILTLPLSEACKFANWPEPWLFSDGPVPSPDSTEVPRPT